MSHISVYVVTHKNCFIPPNRIMKPIQAGCEISGIHIPGMLHDDEGDNISSKNRMYCEMTAQYWAWKNDLDSDYIGFFHYRRYLNFSGKNLESDCWGNVIYDRPFDGEICAELGIDADRMEEIIRQYDAIVPVPRIIPGGKNIYGEYASAEGQHKEDLDMALAVLGEKCPEYAESAKKYMSSERPYEVNMFIMRRDLFKSYAAWVFDILFEVERRSDFSSYNQYELRVMGFLAERLFGIWLTHNQEAKSLRTLELQKTLFKNTDRQGFEIHPAKDAVVAVLACNDAYVPYLAVMLCSVVENAKQDRHYELYVFTTDISSENQARLKHLVESDDRFSFRCINVSPFAGQQNLFVHAHISVETYYRFFILGLFKDIGKVLYLDCDMVANADIADLYDMELSGSYLAAAKDIDSAGAAKGDEKHALYIREIVGCSGPDEYFQAGVLVFNLPEMKKRADMADLLHVAQEWKWNYMDQDILNHVYQKKIVYLDQSWNCVIDWREQSSCRMNILKKAPFPLYCEYLEARKNPKIIHYAGYQKPWNAVNCDFAEYFWKYARETEFYEEILSRLNHKIIEHDFLTRRFLLKCLFGKTLLYRACRKVRRMIAGKKK